MPHLGHTQVYGQAALHGVRRRHLRAQRQRVPAGHDAWGQACLHPGAVLCVAAPDQARQDGVARGGGGGQRSDQQDEGETAGGAGEEQAPLALGVGPPPVGGARASPGGQRPLAAAAAKAAQPRILLPIQQGVVVAVVQIQVKHGLG